MRSFFTNCLAVGLITTLAACGGADGDIFSMRDAPTGPISVAERDQLSAAFTRQSTRVFGYELTEDLGVPTTGRADFDGLAALVVTPTGEDAMTFIGDSAIRADFGEGTVYAQMDSFSGLAMNGLSMRMDGEIVMENGRIGGGGATNVAGAYRGRVGGLGAAIETGGMLFGNFRNTPVAGLSMSGNDATATYNGAPASATLTVVAE